MEMKAFERLFGYASVCNIMSDVKMASLHEASSDIRPDHSQEQEAFKGQAADVVHNGFKTADGDNIILCSNEDNIKNFILNNSGFKVQVCANKSIFTQDGTPVTNTTTIYLFVDVAMHDILMKKTGLMHKSVNKYFIYVAKQKAEMHVVDKCAENRAKFLAVFYQLPTKCRRESKALQITTRKETDEERTGSDESMSSESDDDEDGGDDDEDGGDDDELEDEENEESGDDVTTDPEKVGEYPRTEKGAIPKQMKGVHQNLDDKEASNAFVMVGEHQTLEARITSGQPVYLMQDGKNNTINLTIVHEAKNSNLKIDITSDNPQTENCLLDDISVKKDSINQKLKSKKAQIVSVTKGSVIIDIAVEPGQEMTTDWIKSVLDTVLSDSTSAVVSEGVTLTLDVTSNQVVPFSSLTLKQKQQVSDLVHVELESSTEVSQPSSSPRHSPVPVKELDEMLTSVLKFGVSGHDDATDIAVPFLEVLAYIRDTDPWNIAINYPHLFHAGGPFCNLVKEDIGIEHDKHFQIPAFGDKKFRFKEEVGEIELFVEPDGYLEIGPDIEKHIAEAKLVRKPGKKATEQTNRKGKRSKPLKEASFTTDEDSEVNEEDDEVSELNSFIGNQSAKTKDSADSGFSDGTSESKGKKEGDTSTPVSASE